MNCKEDLKNPRTSGIGVERYYKSPELARELELFDPAGFAGETEIVLGKKSGKYSILFELKKMGLNASEEQVASILSQVKERGKSKKGLVTAEEFEEIASRVLK